MISAQHKIATIFEDSSTQLAASLCPNQDDLIREHTQSNKYLQIAAETISFADAIVKS